MWLLSSLHFILFAVYSQFRYYFISFFFSFSYNLLFYFETFLRAKQFSCIMQGGRGRSCSFSRPRLARNRVRESLSSRAIPRRESEPSQRHPSRDSCFLIHLRPPLLSHTRQPFLYHSGQALWPHLRVFLISLCESFQSRL